MKSILRRTCLITLTLAMSLGTFSSTRLGSALASAYSDHAEGAELRGRLLILPGIRNTRFHLEEFAQESSRLLPGFAVEIRRWGVPMLGLHNLKAHARNVATAAAIARELADWRTVNPDKKIYVVGYSGGGGMAALIVSALPDHVKVDRLILVAPAISQAFDVDERLLPHINEFLVNYASERDLQVGLGTKLFGTIDRKLTQSAGFAGFEGEHARLVEWHWRAIDRRLGHHGNHVAYLGRRWQVANLMPALDPAIDAATLSAQWDSVRAELGGSQ